MSIFVISDLHLSIGEDKPMDIFGPAWGNYTQLIENNWRELVSDGDTVVIPGDISWAMTTSGAAADLSFVNSLPGKKILLKGNHEYWWDTMSKLEQMKKANGFDTISFLHNNGLYHEEQGIFIAGTRGWLVPDDQNFKESTDAQIYRREVMRLENSIKTALADGASKGVLKAPLAVFLHYPPFSRNGGRNGFTEVLEKYNVCLCCFGHLHGNSCNIRVPEYLNVPVKCVSADFLRFVPEKIVL